VWEGSEAAQKLLEETPTPYRQKHCMAPTVSGEGTGGG